MDTSIMDDMNSIKELLPEDKVKEIDNKSKAVILLEKTIELETLELEVKNLRAGLLNAMKEAGIKNIKTEYGKQFIRAEKKNIQVDKDKAKVFLDSQGIYEEFSKIDETKVKKIYPTAEFVTELDPTEYLIIKKCD